MSSKTLVCRFKKPDAGVRLVCFNWAGGGANFYANQWGKIFPDFIEVLGVCLPGREVRYKEPVCNKLNIIIDQLATAIKEQCDDKPFVFWGHSLGAFLAYDVCCELKSRYGMSPDHIFLSGVSAPHTQARKDKSVDVSKYTDEEFVEFLKTLGGTPADIIENREFMQLFLPSLRADYELVNQFSYDHPKDRYVLGCPVDVFDGSDDTKHDLDAWRDITTGAFTKMLLPGGHFYLKEDKNAKKLVKHISESAENCGNPAFNLKKSWNASLSTRLITGNCGYTIGQGIQKPNHIWDTRDTDK